MKPSSNKAPLDPFTFSINFHCDVETSSFKLSLGNENSLIVVCKVVGRAASF